MLSQIYRWSTEILAIVKVQFFLKAGGNRRHPLNLQPFLPPTQTLARFSATEHGYISFVGRKIVEYFLG